MKRLCSYFFDYCLLELKTLSMMEADQFVLQQSVNSSLKGLFNTGNWALDLGVALVISSFIGFVFNYLKNLDGERVWKWLGWLKPGGKKYFHRIEYKATLSDRSGWEVNPDVFGRNIELIRAIYYYIKEVKKVDVTEKKVILDPKAVTRDNTYLEEKDRPIMWLPTERVEFNGIRIEFIEGGEHGENDNKNLQLEVEISAASDEMITDFIRTCHEAHVEKKYGHLKTQQSQIHFLSHYYNSSDIYFTQIKIQPWKTFDNVFFPQKDRLIRYLDRFLEDTKDPEELPESDQDLSKEIDGSNSDLISDSKTVTIPDGRKLSRFSLLLHGPPGTGKTSIIKALANYTGRNVQYVKLSEIRNLLDAFKILFTETITVDEENWSNREKKIPIKKRILVFEDIDRESDKVHRRREEKEKERLRKLERREKKLVNGEELDDEDDREEHDNDDDEEADLDLAKELSLLEKPDVKSLSSAYNFGLNLSDILQILDGIIDIKGLMMVMTTNNVDALDPALIRPGRITMNLHLTYILEEQAHQMIHYHFPNEDEELIKQVKILPNTMTPCQLDNFCLESENIQEVIKFVKDFYNQQE